jgi:protein-tyrosine phosphatase
VIDLHCHILPGIDDGPENVEASLAMARAQVECGVSTVVATPHVSWNYGTSAGSIRPATDALQTAIDAAGIPLRVLAGAEVALTRAVDLSSEQLAELRLGGGPWLLLEPPMAVDSPGIEGMIGMVQSRGSRILLAHPERCAAFHNDSELLARLVRSGCRSQVTAGALTGTFGRTVQTLARRFVDQGLVHVVASDAHDADYRRPGLRGSIADAGYAPLVTWLTADVPGAILENRPLPPRPAFAAERPRWPRWPRLR